MSTKEAARVLLTVTPPTLAAEQHNALRAHVRHVLCTTLEALDRGEYDMESLATIFRTGGKAAEILDFGICDDQPMTFGEVMHKLRALRDLAKFGPL